MAEPKKVTKLTSSMSKKFEGWEITDDYEIVKQVGSGSYGFVVQAKEKATKRKVAIKKFPNVFDDLIDAKRILREVTLLRKLKHENLINMIELLPPRDWENFNEIYLVTDYCQSDLKKLFKSPIHLTEMHIQKLIYNILCGLKYLHSAEVLHRDLKPANVLLNEDCSVKICDFGLARSIQGIEGAHKYDKKKSEDNLISDKYDEKEKKKSDDRINNMKRELTGHVVTRWYRAPEVILLEKDYTVAIDVWSVGCIFAELQGMLKENAPTFLERSPLFPGTSCFPLSPGREEIKKKGGFPHSHTDQLSVIFSVLGTPNEDDFDFVTDLKAIEYLKSFNKKKRMDFREIYGGSSDDAIDFLEKTIVFNPKKRASIEELLAHPYLKKIRDAKNEPVAEGFAETDFEKEGPMSLKRLRELFVNEIKLYGKK